MTKYKVVTTGSCNNTDKLGDICIVKFELIARLIAAFYLVFKSNTGVKIEPVFPWDK